jgi:hypothetical protein
MLNRGVKVCCFNHLWASLHGTLYEGISVHMTELKKLASVADILEREAGPTIMEWLRRVNLIPELTGIPLSDMDRAGHLPKLFQDLIYRLRLLKDAPSPVSAFAAAHGAVRWGQGYTAPMLVDESRLFEVATFGTLHIHQNELDRKHVLLDVMVIADEVDAQLVETVRSLMGAKVCRG